MRFASACTALLFVVACSSPTNSTPGGSTPRTLFNNLSVATGGGTLHYSKTGDPLDGLTLLVPAGAYPTATDWTITADSSVVVPLPSDLSQVGPVLVIGNGQGYATTPISLTVPMVIDAATSVAPFYFDPTTNKLESIPVVAQTGTSVTLAALHFTSDYTATRGPTETALRASSAPFGKVDVVWVKSTNAQLAGTYTTDFRAGRDDWEFANHGDYVSPGGMCEGMSVTELLYQFFIKPPGAATGLYHKYDSSLLNRWDNLQGMHFAGAVQADYDLVMKSPYNTLQGLANANGYLYTASTLVLALKATKEPVMVALQGTGGSGHAVVAYAAVSTGSHIAVSFADPNFPGIERTMTFESGVLTPLALRLSESAPDEFFTKALVAGVTADMPLSTIAARYHEFQTKTAGHDRLPSDFSWISYNFGSQAWDGMGDTVHATGPLFRPAMLCVDCSSKLAGQTPVNRMPVIVYDAQGANIAGSGTDVTLVPGLNNFVLDAEPQSSFRGGHLFGMLDARNVTVLYGGYTLNVQTAPINIAAGFSATDQVLIVRDIFQAGVTVSGTTDGGITISSSPANAAGSVTLTINVPSSASLGTHIVNLVGMATNMPNIKTTFAVVVTAPNTTWAFCPTTGLPTFVAVQDGTGAWARVTSTGNNYAFNIAGTKGGIAWSSVIGTTTTMHVFYGTQAELQSQGSVLCSGGSGATKTVLATVANVGTAASVQLGLGGGLVFVTPPATAFSVSNVLPGAIDLIASTIDGATPPSGIRMILQRGITPVDNASLGTLDFTATGFLASNAGLTLANTLGQNVFTRGQYQTSTAGPIIRYYSDLVSSALTARSFFGVPLAQQLPNDLHYISAQATVGSGASMVFRTTGIAFPTVTAQTLTFGSALSTPTVIGPSGFDSSYVLKATIPLQAEYNKLWQVDYDQIASSGRFATVQMTLGYRGTGAAVLNLPDLSQLAGWNTSYSLVIGTSVIYRATASTWTSGGLTFTSVVNGTTFTSATAAGAITP